MRDPKREKLLLALIAETFQGIQLEDGVSLHKTIEIDMYCSTETTIEACRNDERMDWQKLIHDPELLEVDGIGGLSFYDEKGLRFHLPAYLSVVLLDPSVDISESLLFHLTTLSDYNITRMNFLTPQMKQCIGKVLQYFRTLPHFEYDYKRIDVVLPFYLEKND